MLARVIKIERASGRLTQVNTAVRGCEDAQLTRLSRCTHRRFCGNGQHCCKKSMIRHGGRLHRVERRSNPAKQARVGSCHIGTDDEQGSRTE